jgi:hypothetical protein
LFGSHEPDRSSWPVELTDRPGDLTVDPDGRRPSAREIREDDFGPLIAVHGNGRLEEDMMKRSSMWTITVVVALAWVGCSDLELADVVQGLARCDEMTCSNSLDLPPREPVGCYGSLCDLDGSGPGPPEFDPPIDQVAFLHELNLSGIANRDGLRIETAHVWATGSAQIRKDNGSYNLTVQHGRLIGIAGAAILQAGDLVGAEIRVGAFGMGGTWFSMRIENVRQFAMPFGPSGQVEAYRISVQSHWPDGTAPLCVSNYGGGTANAGALGGMEPGEVIVFEGDRIDIYHKTMNSQPEPDWINFGCAGSAFAKLYLMSETIGTQMKALEMESWRERQAMFKMLVADYCGTGHTFTVPGEPLLWQGGRVSYALPPLNLEARWDEHGATCLGTPRLDAYPDPHSSLSAEILANIAETCGERMPPPCENVDPLDYDDALIVSANRP